jgi:hypothetical protein
MEDRRTFLGLAGFLAFLVVPKGSPVVTRA